MFRPPSKKLPQNCTVWRCCACRGHKRSRNRQIYVARGRPASASPESVLFGRSQAETFHGQRPDFQRSCAVERLYDVLAAGRNHSALFCPRSRIGSKDIEDRAFWMVIGFPASGFLTDQRRFPQSQEGWISSGAPKDYYTIL